MSKYSTSGINLSVEKKVALDQYSTKLASNLPPFSHSIRSENKTNRDSLIEVLPRSASEFLMR